MAQKMVQIIQCPSCNAPYDPSQKKKRCLYCGHYIHVQEINPPLSQPTDEAKLPIWTQGISAQGQANGSLDIKEYTPLTRAQAFVLLNTLPIPPADAVPGEFAFPALGYDERNISRNPDGSYFLWPENKFCDLDEAQNILKAIYEGGPSEPPPSDKNDGWKTVDWKTLVKR